MVDAVAADLGAGLSVTLGFECPSSFRFLKWLSLGTARPGEKNRREMRICPLRPTQAVYLTKT